MLTPQNSENEQREHYGRIHSEYTAHYFDSWSYRYRDQFIHPQLLSGIEWKGKKVLEAMCGAGSIAGELKELGAEVYGLDISALAAAEFASHWESPCITSSMTMPGYSNQSFDVILVLGGLHHLPPQVDSGLDAIFHLLKPGGIFRFFEPHNTSWLDRARKIWYRRDNLFQENESAVNLHQMTSRHRLQFEEQWRYFGGNLAYLLVFNSMIWRMPHWLKGVISPILLWLEKGIRIFQNEKTSCFVIASWRRRMRKPI